LVGCFAPPQQFGREHDMAVAEDIGPDLDLLADDALDWKTAAIDDGVNVFDVDAMLGKVTDGPDAGVGCHGSIALAALSTRPGGGGALMEPRAAPFGSRPRLRSRCAEKQGIAWQLTGFLGNKPGSPLLPVHRSRRDLLHRM